MATSLSYGSKNSRRAVPCVAAHCEAADRLFAFPKHDSARHCLWVRLVNDKVRFVNICCDAKCVTITTCDIA